MRLTSVNRRSKQLDASHFSSAVHRQRCSCASARIQFTRRPPRHLFGAANPPRCVTKQRPPQGARLRLQPMHQSSTGCPQCRCLATCLGTHQSCSCRATLKLQLPSVRLASSQERTTYFLDPVASLSFHRQSFSRCSISALRRRKKRSWCHRN